MRSVIFGRHLNSISNHLTPCTLRVRSVPARRVHEEDEGELCLGLASRVRVLTQFY